MKTSAFSWLFVLLLTGLGRADDLPSIVGETVAPRIAEGKTVGIVVGVVRTGDSQVFGFGRPSLDDDEAPDGKTVFEIGSITKVFTGIALAESSLKGVVGLDDPVATLLPEGVRIPERNGEAITLRRLSNHTSGLPSITLKVAGRDLLGRDPYVDSSPQDVYDFLKDFKLRRDPGTSYAYSNLGAGLLGLSLARRSGLSYEEMILKKICKPLGMNDTKITVDSRYELRLAKPYKSSGDPAIRWNFDAFAGCGALRSTVDDMVCFIRANLGEVAVPDDLRDAMTLARTPRSTAGREDVQVALGWHVFLAQPKTQRPEIVWHNGGTGGFRSFLGIAVKQRIGVVVLSNSNQEVDSIAMKILIRLLQPTKDAPTSPPLR